MKVALLPLCTSIRKVDLPRHPETVPIKQKRFPTTSPIAALHVIVGMPERCTILRIWDKIKFFGVCRPFLLETCNRTAENVLVMRSNFTDKIFLRSTFSSKLAPKALPARNHSHRSRYDSLNQHEFSIDIGFHVQYRSRVTGCFRKPPTQ